MRLRKEIKENIYNFANFLTFTRLIGSFILIYLIFKNYSRITLAIVFLLFALTDCVDGLIARKFNQKTKFGKYFDPVVDRIFMISFVSGLIIKFGVINKEILFQLLPFILTREIISLPFYIFVKKFTVKFNVKVIGKFTTGLQSITIPFILFNLSVSPFLIVLTAISGVVSGVTYAKDSFKQEDLNKKIVRKNY